MVFDATEWMIVIFVKEKKKKEDPFGREHQAQFGHTVGP